MAQADTETETAGPHRKQGLTDRSQKVPADVPVQKSDEAIIPVTATNMTHSSIKTGNLSPAEPS